MGAITTPEEVKLIVGMISGSGEILAEAAGRLESEFGPIDLTGEVMDFEFTHYYDEEMGTGLLRQFIAFAEFIAPDQIVAIKRITNDIEGEFGKRGQDPFCPQTDSAITKQSQQKDECLPDGSPVQTKRVLTPFSRKVNLDPGYITESKLVLASTKDFSHRIYLSDGIYAEVTLMYVRGRWVSQPYTFPDYASGRYDEFLTRARDALRVKMGRKGSH